MTQMTKLTVAPECACVIGDPCLTQGCCYFGGLVPDNVRSDLLAPRSVPIAWVLWRWWHDGSSDPEVLRVYTDKARADEDFELFRDVLDVGRKYALTEAPWFGP